MDKRPIGIFDSGLGGLSVVREIIKFLPREDIIYLGDTARVPYGTRSAEVVKRFSLEDANFLLSKNVKCIVIACNTASAHAGDLLKRKIKAPVFEVITFASERAIKISKNGKIGVIGTTGTIRSGAYEKELKRVSPKVKVTTQACPLLVPLIEEGEFGEVLYLMIKKYLTPLKRVGIDTLILGCTHYPIIEGKLRDYLGKDVNFVNPGKEVANELKSYLEIANMLSKSKKGKREYFVTDLTDGFVKVGELFLGKKIKPRFVEINI